MQSGAEVDAELVEVPPIRTCTRTALYGPENRTNAPSVECSEPAVVTSRLAADDPPTLIHQLGQGRSSTGR